MSYDFVRNTSRTYSERFKDYCSRHVVPTWTFVAKFRFVFYCVCIFLTPHTDAWDRMFDVNDPVELISNPGCKEECDIAVFERNDLLDPQAKMLPRWTYLVSGALCFFSNDLIKICQPLLLMLYVLWLPVATCLTIASAFVVVNHIEVCDIMCQLLPFITFVAVIFDWVVMYQLLFRKRQLSVVLATIIELPQDTKMTIMEMAKAVNYKFKILGRHIFMRNSGGKIDNEVLNQIIERDTKLVYDVPRLIESHLLSSSQSRNSTESRSL